MNEKQIKELISETGSAASYAAQAADTQLEIVERLDRIIELLDEINGRVALQ